MSADERRQQRHAQLLEGCLDVVGEMGIAGATVNAVSDAAGLSKRYFYESFSDLEAVLVAALDLLFARVNGDITTALNRASDGVEEPEEARVRLVVTTLVDSLLADPRAARLYVEAPRQPALELRRLRAHDEFAGLLINEHVLDIDASTSRAYSTALMVVAGTTELLARWLAGDLEATKSDMIDTIAGVGLGAAAFISGDHPR